MEAFKWLPSPERINGTFDDIDTFRNLNIVEYALSYHGFLDYFFPGDVAWFGIQIRWTLPINLILVMLAYPVALLYRWHFALPITVRS